MATAIQLDVVTNPLPPEIASLPDRLVDCLKEISHCKNKPNMVH